MDNELKTMLDLVAGDETAVEVEVLPDLTRPNKYVLWVNVDGICRLRIGQISSGAFRAAVARGLRVKRVRS